MRLEKVLVVGGTSSIGFEVAKLFARDRASIILAGRNLNLIEKNCDILHKLGATQAETMLLDMLDIDRHPTVTSDAATILKGLDGVLISHGVAHPQIEMERNPVLAKNEIEINLSATVSLLLYMAFFFQKRCRGVIAVVSSVAGEKGRREQHIYASTKSGLSTFMDGFRYRLVPFGIRVLTIKPGLTETPLTKNIRTPFRRLLFSKPETIGKIIYHAMQYGNGNVYAPWYWRWILMVMKLMPDPFFLIFKNGFLDVKSNPKTGL